MSGNYSFQYRKLLLLLVVQVLAFFLFQDSSLVAQCVTQVDFTQWQAEGPQGQWAILGGGDSVRQNNNTTAPTFYVSPDTFMNVTIRGDFRVATNFDDDYVGFVFGYNDPFGTPTNDYDFWLFDWKQSTQTQFLNGNTAREGFSLARVNGIIPNNNSNNFFHFWGHNDGVNYTLIDTLWNDTLGWQNNTTYTLELFLTELRVVIMVDGDTIFDVPGCYDPGRFGFYNLSQQRVVYKDFDYELHTDFNLGSTVVCEGDSTEFIFSDTSCSQSGITNISSWRWDFADGDTSNLINPKHVYDTGGIYNVQLVVTDNAGCTDTAYNEVEILNLPEAHFGFSNTCFNDSVLFTDSSTVVVGNTVHSVTDWNWLFGDGNDDTLQQNPKHRYANVGTYSVTLVATTDSGCIDTTIIDVPIDTLPLANFQFNTVCPGDTSVFTDVTQSISGHPLVTWEWDIGDDNSIDYTSQNATHLFPSVVDTHDIRLTVTDSLGCSSDTLKEQIINPLPEAGFDFSNVCLGDAMNFADTSSVNTGNITGWSWDFGDGSPLITNQNPNHTYSTADTFTVTLTATTDSGCVDTDTNTIPAVVWPLPTPSFSYTQTCLDDSMSFTDLSSSSVGQINSWNWDFGDGNSSTDQNPRHLYNNSGTFQVKLVIGNDTGCTDSITQPVVVDQLPVPAFTFVNLCPGDTAFFVDASTSFNGPLVSWNYDIEDNGTVDYFTQNANHIYPTAPDTHAVELVVQDSLGCTDSLTRNIVMNPEPTPGFQFTNVCLGAPMNFTDTSTIFTGSLVAWTWDFGDGSAIDTTQNPSHFYTAPGPYSIDFTVESDSGCIASLSGAVQIIVNPLPNTGFTFNDVCLSDSAVFTDTSSILSGNITEWEWDFGDGSPVDSNQHTKHKYANFGSYVVSLSANSDSNCLVIATDTIEIFELPVSNFMTSNECLNDTTFFVDQSTISTGSITQWAWDFGDSSPIDTNQNTSNLFAMADTFDVQLVATSNQGCVDTLSQPVIVYHLPVVDFQFSSLCPGDTAFFVDQSTSPNGSTINSWFWDVQNDNIVDYTNQNSSHIYSSTPDTHSVELRVSDQLGCTDSTVLSIVMNPGPVAGFTLSNVCFNDQASFTDTSTLFTGSIVAWSWDLGDGTIDSNQNPTHLYGAPDTFQVSLTVVSDSGCVHTTPTTTPIINYDLPVADFTVINACLYDSLQFTDASTSAEGVITGWSWNFADGSGNGLTQNIEHLYSTAGVYPVELTITTEYGCKDTHTVNSIAFHVPNTDFEVDDVCLIDTARFIDLSSIDSGSITNWNWEFGDANTSTIPNPINLYPAAGSFDIKLITTSNQGCVDSISKAIMIQPMPVASFSFNDTCAGMPYRFFDNSTLASGLIGSWLWDFGDMKNLSAAVNPIHLYDTGGTYDVKLIVESEFGCLDSTIGPINVFYLPVVDFVADTLEGCSPLPIRFTNQSVLASGDVATYSWQLTDDSISTVENAVMTYENTTQSLQQFDINLTVTTGKGCVDSLRKSDLIEVYPLPIASFSFTPEETSVLAPVIFFRDESIGGVEWLWNFGDGDTSDFQFPEHEYFDFGTFDIRLTTTNQYECINDTLRSLLIESKPAFYIPNSFTPNGDGINDFFSPLASDLNRNAGLSYELYIYDRWGKLMFKSFSLDDGWDGNYNNGKPVPNGTYAYFIQYIDAKGGSWDLSGSITVIR